MASSSSPTGSKLHLGCGDVALEGWINIDVAPYPAVDAVHDVTRDLPYSECAFAFAEHFIEHLDLDDGVRFLGRCRSALAEDGVLRLTTPNLDWVWATQYHHGSWSGPRQAIEDCLRLNRSFYGWGHRFLYNWESLELVLHGAGFANVVRCGRGTSDHAALRDLERHEAYADSPELPHVLVAEASGLLPRADRPSLPGFGEYRRDTKAPFHQLQFAALSAARLVSRLLGKRPAG